MEPQPTSTLQFDITVDENDYKAGVTELMCKLRPHWNPAEIKLKLFTDGITNKLLGCYTDDSMEDTLLIRIYGNMTELFVNRANELKNLQILHANHCGPKLYCTFKNGICYEFVKGTVLDKWLVREPRVFRLVAQALARIHSIQLENGSSVQPVLWKKLSTYLSLIRASGDDSAACVRFSADVPSLEVLASEIEALKQHLSQIKSPAVLCHNDLLCKNIIYNEAQGYVRFIDYEYADWNYQAYDIGNHFNEFAGVTDVDYRLYPSQQLQTDWLGAYLETYKERRGMAGVVTEAEVHRLYVQVNKFALAGHFSWGLWALLQSRYSKIDFDFVRYAAARFNFYFRMKADVLDMKLP
ncbi:ethanolamine kinase 1-like isoform X1 [Polypterus senegalus]|uniref:ethanolamine kinase 1-like isoform X1 n=1 Tax=Polypterus senegalus TaxID=55291 RepID=UPI0019665A23|nr:ethanolamine kinase 1-like isoform X1 [Polypterus senegalus]